MRSSVDWNLPARYSVKKQIGSGAYGEVAAAFDHQTQQYVAIKRFQRIFNDTIDCKRMLREISILSQMKSSLVVRLLDIVIPDPIESFTTVYIILEIADSDIKKLIREPIQLNPLHTKCIMYNLLAAMKVIHDAGIIHRDLKPANILLNKDCTLKMCDFGLSRSLLRRNGYASPRADPSAEDDDPVPPTANQENYTRHVVTRWYRAPEIILVQPEYGTAIDVWSIGCIFAELLQTEKRSVARQPLFPGSYCYPLSPRRRHEENADRTFLANDQLRIIFSVIGTPSEEDLEDLDRDDARAYIRSFRKYEPIDFYERFHWVDKSTVDLLVSMLHFNPRKRISVEEALKHPYFSDITPFEFPKNPIQVRIPVDGKKYKNVKLTEPLLRQLISEEVEKLHTGSGTSSISNEDGLSTTKRMHRAIYDGLKKITRRK